MKEIEITNEDPPKRKGGPGRHKTKLSLAIESMKKGQCIKYRGDKDLKSTSSHVSLISRRCGKQYTCRTVEGGINIYCIAETKNTKTK